MSTLERSCFDNRHGLKSSGLLSITASDHAAVTEVKFPKDQMQKRSRETRRSSASSIETEDGTDVCVTQESQHGEMGIDVLEESQ